MDTSVEIIDRIFLGSYESAKDLQFIRKQNITVIVNCTKNLNDIFSYLKIPIAEAPLEIQQWIKSNSYYIEYFRIPVDDLDKLEENELFYHKTKEILPKIIELYDSGQTILVHCLAGVQRSASFVSILISCLMNISVDDAISIVQIKKPNTFFFGTKYHFIRALHQLETEYTY